MNGTIEQVVKQSVIYGYMLSQPFSAYIDVNSVKDNQTLLEAENFKYGTHGKTVHVLQKKLTSLSYYKDNVDGAYGIHTELAIKKLQKIHDLNVTGQIDAPTIKHMIDEEYALHLEQLENLSESIKPNQHGEDVKVVQQALQYLGYYEGEIDGIYGPLTKKALQVAEDQHGIQLSEEVTREMLTTLFEIEQFESADHIKQSYIEDVHIDNLKRYTEGLDIGMRNEDIKIVQRSLQYFGFYDDTIDGSFGPLTKKGIKLAENALNIDLGTAQNVLHEPVQMNGSQPAEQHNFESENKQSTDNVEDKQQLEHLEQLETKPSHDRNVIDTARSVMGTPYVWGGTSRDGFDCSGFIQFAFESADITIPRTVSDVWNFSNPVSAPSVGDFVFFETYQPGPSHMGIYLGNDQFIHAGVSNGVEIADLNQSYWQQRYIGAKRIQ